jgi:exopolysaccharide production protein ExoY
MGAAARLDSAYGRSHERLMQPLHPAVAVAEPALLQQPEAARPGMTYHCVKRVIDIIGGLIGLLVLAVLFLPIALLINLEDGGPIIYRREAVGLHGRLFHVLKFRSMCREADHYFDLHPECLPEYLENVKLRDDPRVTRVGRILRKASLDELPQVINVLRGEMSLVGPRYVHPDELIRYGEFAEQRQHMRPGITGMWQVRVRCNAPYSSRLMYDSQYYHTRSLRTDVAILLATIPAVVRGRGAY